MGKIMQVVATVAMENVGPVLERLEGLTQGVEYHVIELKYRNGGGVKLGRGEPERIILSHLKKNGPMLKIDFKALNIPTSTLANKLKQLTKSKKIGMKNGKVVLL